VKPSLDDGERRRATVLLASQMRSGVVPSHPTPLRPSLYGFPRRLNPVLYWCAACVCLPTATVHGVASPCRPSACDD